MKVLIVFKKGYSQDMRIIVSLHTKLLKASVLRLMDQNRKREAFDLIISKAQVTEYVPPGERLLNRPEFILKEDLLD